MSIDIIYHDTGSYLYEIYQQPGNQLSGKDYFAQIYDESLFYEMSQQE